MSSTGRGKPRDPLDRHYTPDALACAIVQALPTAAGPGFGWILEPSVGGGAFAVACQGRWPGAEIRGMDLDEDAAGRVECDKFMAADFLTAPPVYLRGQPTLIIGNPPFSGAELHVRRALQVVDKTGGSVVFLLRLAFLASQSRAAGLWREYPPTEVLVLGRRPSFSGDGKTDSADYAVFRWTFRDGAPVARLPVGWLDWSET